jgi:hypothetical protein
VLAAVPMRGGLPTAVPTDPTIYRFYEALQVYGGAIKELIHEQFGDGIMTCAKTTPAETAGPFPADGSNGPNVLGEDGVVRSDIRTSFGVLSGWAEGVQTTIERQELSSRRSGRRPGRPRVLHLGLPGLRERSMATHQRRGVRFGRIGRCR